MKTLSHRDEAEECLKHLYDVRVERVRAAEEADRAFLEAADAATSEELPSAERVRVATLAKRIGLPRGTLLARLDRYRSGKDDPPG